MYEAAKTAGNRAQMAPPNNRPMLDGVIDEIDVATKDLAELTSTVGEFAYRTLGSPAEKTGAIEGTNNEDRPISSRGEALSSRLHGLRSQINLLRVQVNRLSQI